MRRDAATGPHDPRAGAPPARALDRRDFLKISGFTLGGALLAGCQPAKVEKAIPFLIKPEEVTPGVSTWYATTCGGCPAGCGVMAKVRDGRPIKLEGVQGHPISGGGLCAVGQAHLLALYDSHRLMGPVAAGGASTTWEALDAGVRERLAGVRASGRQVRILTGTLTSPTTKEAIRRFLAGFSDGRHVEYDALSASAILDAHEKTHGVRVLPRYRFDRAKVIVSFHAGFLGSWISPVEYTAGYRKGRALKGAASAFSYHVQYESRLSVTGSNADLRECKSPTEVRAAIEALASQLGEKAGSPGTSIPSVSPAVRQLADRLWNARGRSLVVCGFNDLPTQLLVNSINHLLGNYGSTIDIERPSHQKQGSDAALLELISELRAGSVGAMIIQGCNPVYDLPVGKEFGELLRKVPLVIRCTDRLDETADASTYVCPEPHALESWNDAEPVAGTVTVAQPVIRPFGSTRTLAENILAWTGEKISALDAIRREWRRSVFPRRAGAGDFEAFWDDAVEHGFSTVEPDERPPSPFNARAVTGRLPFVSVPPEGTSFELLLYPSFSMLDGRHAHNPWLHELPDPETKIVWDNYVSISPASAGRLGIEEGDIVRVEADGRALELPAHIQPGQHDTSASIALGYGRRGTDRFTSIGPRWLQAEPTVPPGGLVGRNAAPLLTLSGGSLLYDLERVSITKTGGRAVLACTQEYHTLEVPEHFASGRDERRPIVQETTLAAYVNDPAAGSRREGEIVSLWADDHHYTGHRWGMAIDLAACTGCSACVVSCMAENNIPVVGKDEVRRNRELSWIRVDRYYEERGAGRVAAVHQPMLCQHCGNAPCETVCPVLATVHSEEGLNQQVYNRCVGTRYCSNNCPYKVRRFNWFAYEHGDERERLVLNPDVTVRERGVMEKCSFCVQRIQEAKIEAKNNGVPVKDGDIRPACAQSCPAQAIVFGDMNDPKSAVSAQLRDPRSYRVLEELGVQPSVGYLRVVRNTEDPGRG